MLLKLKSKESGFTIIEVMIVLAIAALILVVVLVAVPQLQRNQRNQARQSILSRVKAELDNYAGNNNGSYPSDAGDITSFTNRYLNGININDPRSGTSMPVVYTTSGNTVGAVPTATEGTINYSTNRSCNGEELAAGSGRQYAIWTALEGGAVFCLDNR